MGGKLGLMSTSVHVRISVLINLISIIKVFVDGTLPFLSRQQTVSPNNSSHNEVYVSFIYT